MNHKKAGQFSTVASVFGYCVFMLSLLPIFLRPVAGIVMASGFIIVMIGVFIAYKYSRCPKCRKFLRPYLTKANYCPHCGEKL